MRRYFEYLNLLILCLTSVVLIPLQLKIPGFALLILGLLLLFACSRQFAKDILLIYISLFILGITEINTDISYAHMLVMGITLSIAVALPYCVSRFIYKDHLVRFKFHHGRAWYKREVAYIFLTAIVCYLLIPFYLSNTRSYLNWRVDPGLGNIIRLFVGTNGLGIWDELFFISTVLGILRRFVSFKLANIVQAVLFTSFLYELGFRGWGYIMIFLFALIQGYVFKKTESLFYVITIHLTLDFILFLALVNAHHPDWIDIFITD